MRSRGLILALCLACFLAGQAQHRADSLLKVIAASPADSTVSQAYFQLTLLSMVNSPRQALDNINRSIVYYQKYSSDFPYLRYQKKVSIFRLLANLDSSIYYNNLLYARAAKEDRHDVLADIFAEYGLISLAQNNNQKAVEYFGKQLAAIRRYKLSYDLAGVYNNMGIAYGNTGDWSMAKEYFLKALHQDMLHAKMGNLGNDYNNIGVVFIIEQSIDSARSYFRKSLEYRRIANDSLGIGGTYNNLALLENERADYKKALLYADSAMAIAGPNDYKKLQTEIYDTYDQIYSRMGNYKMAYEFLNRKNKQSALFEKEKFTNDIHQLETDILAEQNQSQLLQKNLELTRSEKQKQFQLFVLLIAVVLIIALIIFLYYFFRNNKLLSKQNQIISNQKQLIEEKHKDITDSITYAHRIQSSLIPSLDQLQRQYRDVEVLFRPKDIVSGDFYWCSHVGGQYVFALADCTGHGVPGAFMSIIGINSLNRIVNEKGITAPAAVLDELRQQVIKSLNADQAHTDKKDGMDVALITFGCGRMQFAGANQSALILRQGELIQLKGNKQPVGASEQEAAFAQEELELQPGDRILLFSDGIVDQFGGKEGKKLKIKTFRSWLLETGGLPMSLQLKELERRLLAFMEGYEQTDDITLVMIGI